MVWLQWGGSGVSPRNQVKPEKPGTVQLSQVFRVFQTWKTWNGSGFPGFTWSGEEGWERQGLYPKPRKTWKTWNGPGFPGLKDPEDLENLERSRCSWSCMREEEERLERGEPPDLPPVDNGTWRTRCRALCSEIFEIYFKIPPV